MPINATNFWLNSGGGYNVGQNYQQDTPPSLKGGPSSGSLPADLQQICRPPTVPLDAESAQRLADYMNYDSLTQASLNAISQTLRMNDQLLQALGSKKN